MSSKEALIKIVAELVIRFGIAGLFRLLRQMNAEEGESKPTDRDVFMLARSLGIDPEADSDFEIVPKEEYDFLRVRVAELEEQASAPRKGSRKRKTGTHSARAEQKTASHSARTEQKTAAHSARTEQKIVAENSVKA